MMDVQGNDEKRISYSGKISIDPAVKIAGFKAAGLTVTVCCHYYCLNRILNYLLYRTGSCLR